MYARVTTIEGSPDRMDDAKRHTQEQTLPQLQKMDGFKGFVALGDRHSGKLVGVAFWESEEALRATDEAVSSVRSGVAEAASGTVASVEHYEVLVNEAPSAGPLGAVTGTVGGVTDTGAGHATGKRGHRHGGEPRATSWGVREEKLAKGGNDSDARRGEAGTDTPRPPSSCPYSTECVEVNSRKFTVANGSSTHRQAFNDRP